MQKVSPRLYLFALASTLLIFAIAILVSVSINNQKTTALQEEEDTLAINILSLENQSDLLAAQSKDTCPATATTTAATMYANLNDLQNKISFMQGQLGAQNPDIFRLERYYALLEIKEYAFEHALATTCNQKNVFILYFYPEGTCSACLTQEYILEAVKQSDPAVHVYSFDTTADLPALKSLASLPNIPASTTPPFFIINNTVYSAFNNYADIQTIIGNNQ